SDHTLLIKTLLSVSILYSTNELLYFKRSIFFLSCFYKSLLENFAAESKHHYLQDKTQKIANQLA
ncbi:hypothetical protein, partial [Bacillus toyonensis]|uniref:hypothetical protein n=1 Tax=Bacillus toyonensis TaxID=155322 RepID=UPI001C3F4644